MSRDLKLISDPAKLTELIRGVIDANPKEHASYKAVSDWINPSVYRTHSVSILSQVVGQSTNVKVFHVYVLMGREQGKTRLFGFFVGQVMEASNRRADPVQSNDILKQLLDE